MKQINIIESLRALAAISVCLFHFVCTVIGLFNPEDVLPYFGLGSYGVQVFFVISGFIIPYSMYHANYKISAFFKFMAKRLARLEPPYLVSVILVILIMLIKHHFKLGVDEFAELSINRVLLHLGYLINFFPTYHWLNNVYWTLAIEFQFYIFMAIFYFLFTHKNSFIRIASYLLCFAMSIFKIGGTQSHHFPYYAPLFLIGIAAFLYQSAIIKKYEFWVLFIACMLYHLFYIDYKYAIVGGLTALSILYFPQVKIPILHSLGKISYSIYLIHPIIGVAVINVLSKYVHTTIEKIGIVLLGLIVTLISSYIMYYIIEKPSKKLSSSIKLS